VKISRRNLVVAGMIALMLLSVAALPAEAQAQVHVVRRGETLTAIAARYGTTPQAIVRLNGLANANRIYAGQRLKIPGGSAATSGTPATL